MKKILIGMFFLCSTSILFAQNDRDDRTRNRNDRHDRNDKVPDNVQRSFQQQYPNVQNTQWNYTNGQWHTQYTDNNNRVAETYYTRDGRRIDTHYTYNQNDLPANVREGANRRYHSDYNSYRIEPSEGRPYYQIRTKDGKTVYMDENGNRRVYKDKH